MLYKLYKSTPKHMCVSQKSGVAKRLCITQKLFGFKLDNKQKKNKMRFFQEHKSKSNAFISSHHIVDLTHSDRSSFDPICLGFCFNFSHHDASFYPSMHTNYLFVALTIYSQWNIWLKLISQMYNCVRDFIFEWCKIVGEFSD